MKRAITGTFGDDDKESYKQFEIHISSEFLEPNRAKFYSSIVFFNEKSKEE
jgi:hypothetical protein